MVLFFSSSDFSSSFVSATCCTVRWKLFSRGKSTSVCCYRLPQQFLFDRHICCEPKLHLILFIYFFICSMFILRKEHVSDERVRETVSSSRVNKIHIAEANGRWWRKQTRTRHSQILHNFYAIIYKHICLSACALVWHAKGLGRLYILWLNQFVALFFYPLFSLFVRSRISLHNIFRVFASHSLFLSRPLWLLVAAAFPQESWKFRVFILLRLALLSCTHTNALRCMCVWLALWRNTNNKQTNGIHWGIRWILIWIWF